MRQRIQRSGERTVEVERGEALEGQNVLHSRGVKNWRLAATELERLERLREVRTGGEERQRIQRSAVRQEERSKQRQARQDLAHVLRGHIIGLEREIGELWASTAQ